MTKILKLILNSYHIFGISHLVFFKKTYVFVYFRYLKPREGELERKKFYTSLFTSQTTAVARMDLGQSQESRASCDFSTWVAGA